MGKFVIQKSSNGQYYFNLKAGNNETILTSEMYTNKAGAENGIASVRTNSQIDSRYESKTSTSGKHYFVLKAGNYEIIGTSEMYTSANARDIGIAAVKTNAPTDVVEDLTK